MSELKLLITTDFHADRPALAGLRQLVGKQTYDGVIMAGDLINPHQSEMDYVKNFIGLFKDEYRLPLFGLHGNNEPEEAWRYYREAGINIHLENREFFDYNICGVGGLGLLNEAGFEGLSVQNLVINEKTIFVTHVPPKAGVIPARGPLVHIFGHRHTYEYAKKVNQSLMIQCPAGNRGRVTELILPSLEVKFVNLF